MMGRRGKQEAEFSLSLLVIQPFRRKWNGFFMSESASRSALDALCYCWRSYQNPYDRFAPSNNHKALGSLPLPCRLPYGGHDLRISEMALNIGVLQAAELLLRHGRGLLRRHLTHQSDSRHLLRVLHRCRHALNAPLHRLVKIGIATDCALRQHNRLWRGPRRLRLVLMQKRQNVSLKNPLDLWQERRPSLCRVERVLRLSIWPLRHIEHVALYPVQPHAIGL